MANVVALNKDDAETTDFSAGTNLTDLSKKVDLSPYLSRHGDVVAMMVLEHQTFLHNLITRANFLTRAALADAVEMNKALGRPLDYRSESTVGRINNAVEPLVRGMLFSEETKLTDRVVGTSGFQKEFEARGPRDAKGRSLREFDLRTRMFRYPCSYLIYGESFDALPPEARERFYARLGEVLTGADRSKEFEHLSDADRRAILEILLATKKGLPKGFGGR
jgi:hypothetical protein